MDSEIETLKHRSVEKKNKPTNVFTGKKAKRKGVFRQKVWFFKIFEVFADNADTLSNFDASLIKIFFFHTYRELYVRNNEEKIGFFKMNL